MGSNFCLIITINYYTQAEIVQTLCKDHKVDINQIAVLTPYSAQKVVIAKKMKEVKLDIKVASITESQGDTFIVVANLNVVAKSRIIYFRPATIMIKHEVLDFSCMIAYLVSMFVTCGYCILYLNIQVTSME